MEAEVDRHVQRELQAVSPWRALGPPVLVRFPVANASYEVRHLLEEVPDGFLVIDADARIKRTPGVPYEHELAFVQADMANATAVLVFGVLREKATDVNAS